MLHTWCPIRGLLLSVVLLPALLCVAARLASIIDDCLVVETAEKQLVYVYVYERVYVYGYFLRCTATDNAMLIYNACYKSQGAPQQAGGLVAHETFKELYHNFV